MIKYSQPSFFKFGNDSLYLSEFIANERNKSSHLYLEVGTGCGVISLELAKEDSQISIQAIEPQSLFYEHFDKNIDNYKITNVELVRASLEEFSTINNKTYDVIFLNPPYFWNSESRPSPDENRDQCRRMKKEVFAQWLKTFHGLLNEFGELFLCYRSNDVEMMIRDSKGWNIIQMEKTQGCSLIQLRRKL